MSDLLVLWDVDGTLLNADGVGGELYNLVFLQLFGRSLDARPPMAGRTDRAIILETLELAGIPEPRRYVDPFIAGLTAHAPSVREAVVSRGRALPGAAAALTALASARTPQTASARTPQTVRTLASAAPPGESPPPGEPGPLAPPGEPGPLAPPGEPGPLAPPGEPGRVRQSVLTGNIRPVAEVKLAALGLRDPLDLCIGAYGDDHEVRTELVQVARRRAAAVHGRSAADFGGLSTVLVGDTPLDIEAALAAGARAVGVATGPYAAADLLAAGAHAVLPDLVDTSLVVQAILSSTEVSPSPALSALSALPVRAITPAAARWGRVTARGSAASSASGVRSSPVSAVTPLPGPPSRIRAA